MFLNVTYFFSNIYRKMHERERERGCPIKQTANITNIGKRFVAKKGEESQMIDERFRYPWISYGHRVNRRPNLMQMKIIFHRTDWKENLTNNREEEDE